MISALLTNKLVLAILMLIGALMVLHLTSETAFAQDAQKAVCESIGLADGEGGCTGNDGSGVIGIVKAGLDILTFIAGILAVVMLVFAGMKYITSGGDSGSIKAARDSVIYALVGIAIVVISQVIVRFVISEAANPRAPESAPAQPQRDGDPRDRDAI